MFYAADLHSGNSIIYAVNKFIVRMKIGTLLHFIWLTINDGEAIHQTNIRRNQTHTLQNKIIH